MSDTPLTARLDALRPALLAFASRMLADTTAAEDAVQDCLATVLHQEQAPRQPRAFCFRVLRNLCHNRQRDSRRRRDRDRLQTGMDQSLTQAGALTRMVQAEDAAAVFASLRQLSPAQREVLQLRYIDGLERQEIAEVLELEVAVVKSRLFEGVRRLRQLHGAD